MSVNEIFNVSPILGESILIIMVFVSFLRKIASVCSIVTYNGQLMSTWNFISV